MVKVEQMKLGIGLDKDLFDAIYYSICLTTVKKEHKVISYNN